MSSKIMSRIIFIILLCVFIVSAFLLAKSYYDRKMPLVKLKHIEKEVITGDGQFDWDKFESSVSINYRNLSWLQIDDVLSLPVAQVNDNFYLLDKDLNGKYALTGSLFIDYKVEKPYEQAKTIIYGHNMVGGEGMFTSLLNYYNDNEFFNKHKKGTIYTKDKKYTIEITKAVKADATNSDIYDLNTTEFMEENQKYVLMSTCVTAYSRDRIVVYAKITKEEIRK